MRRERLDPRDVVALANAVELGRDGAACMTCGDIGVVVQDWAPAPGGGCRCPPPPRPGYCWCPRGERARARGLCLGCAGHGLRIEHELFEATGADGLCACPAGRSYAAELRAALTEDAREQRALHAKLVQGRAGCTFAAAARACGYWELLAEPEEAAG